MMDTQKRFLVVIVDESAGVAGTFQVVAKLDHERPDAMRDKLTRAFTVVVASLACCTGARLTWIGVQRLSCIGAFSSKFSLLFRHQPFAFRDPV